MQTDGRTAMMKLTVTNKFHCFTVRFSSMNLIYQLMHFYIQ